MKTLNSLISRNTKLFFKDKGMFFTSLITPLILLVLYSTFLAKVFRDSFASGIPDVLNVSQKLINGCAASQLFSSLLAVCCVTVAFCSNFLMVQDKVNGSIHDLTITPVKSASLALSYYISTAISTLIICFTATGISFIYIAKVGWYLSLSDVLLILLDVFLLVMFGTALSSVINFFLSSQGQISAVGTIVSAGYGFVCGAYMPISQFGSGVQKVISFLPGTYGTALIRNHALNGVFREMKAQNFPKEVVDGMRDSIDCNLYFYSHEVNTEKMYLIIAGTILALIIIYVLLNMFKKKK